MLFGLPAYLNSGHTSLTALLRACSLCQVTPEILQRYFSFEANFIAKLVWGIDGEQIPGRGHGSGRGQRPVRRARDDRRYQVVLRCRWRSMGYKQGRGGAGQGGQATRA